MNKHLLAIGMFSLCAAGCGHLEREPRVITKPVYLPTATPCVPRGARIDPPVVPDTDAALKAAGGAADRYGMMAAGRKLRDQWIAEVAPILRSCRSSP